MLTIETQVIDGVITSSPGPISIALSNRCIAAVAEERATPYRLPVSEQTPSSNA